jgi:hypothetical protein
VTTVAAASAVLIIAVVVVAAKPPASKPQQPTVAASLAEPRLFDPALWGFRTLPLGLTWVFKRRVRTR